MYKNTKLPLVSVIMAVYNYGRYLREAIDSALGQTYPNYEVILVDDGSTDETAEIALSCGSQVHYHFQTHQGLSAPKNEGVRLAQGEYIKKRLEVLMAPFIGDADVEIAFGRLHNFLLPEAIGKKEIFESLSEPMNGICPGTMLIKKASFLKVGYFKSEWTVTEFLD